MQALWHRFGRKRLSTACCPQRLTNGKISVIIYVIKDIKIEGLVCYEKNGLFITACMLVAAMLVGVLAGCTSDETPDISSDDSSSMSAESAETDSSTTDASKAPSEGLAYEVNSDGETCKVIGIGTCTCTDTDLVIPFVMDGYTVTGIGYEAFSYCTVLKTIDIPNSATLPSLHPQNNYRIL